VNYGYSQVFGDSGPGAAVHPRSAYVSPLLEDKDPERRISTSTDPLVREREQRRAPPELRPVGRDSFVDSLHGVNTISSHDFMSRIGVRSDTNGQAVFVDTLQGGVGGANARGADAYLENLGGRDVHDSVDAAQKQADGEAPTRDKSGVATSYTRGLDEFLDPSGSTSSTPRPSGVAGTLSSAPVFTGVFGRADYADPLAKGLDYAPTPPVTPYAPATSGTSYAPAPPVTSYSPGGMASTAPGASAYQGATDTSQPGLIDAASPVTGLMRAHDAMMADPLGDYKPKF
jgi:hypothetical protein